MDDVDRRPECVYGLHRRARQIRWTPPMEDGVHDAAQFELDAQTTIRQTSWLVEQLKNTDVVLVIN